MRYSSSLRSVGMTTAELAVERIVTQESCVGSGGRNRSDWVIWSIQCGPCLSAGTDGAGATRGELVQPTNWGGGVGAGDASALLAWSDCADHSGATSGRSIVG